MKNKLLISLILCAALCMGFGLSASAADLYNVSDAAGILAAEDLVNLDEQARTVSEYYGCGVYIVIVNDYRDYVNGSMQDFSEAVYRSYNLGLGEGKDGIMLALSMEERDYDLCAYGDWANYAFTDHGKDKLAEQFLDNFRNNDWAGGFNDYIAYSVSLMDLAKNGNPLDIMIYEEEEPEKSGYSLSDIALITLLPAGAGYGVCSGFKSQMKTARRQNYASSYVDSGRIALRTRSDQFLYRNISRTRIRRDDDGPRVGGGGRPGGTTINSGGFSHKGGKF